jgi:hypothetical protein
MGNIIIYKQYYNIQSHQCRAAFKRNTGIKISRILYILISARGEPPGWKCQEFRCYIQNDTKHLFIKAVTRGMVNTSILFKYHQLKARLLKY